MSISYFEYTNKCSDYIFHSLIFLYKKIDINSENAQKKETEYLVVRADPDRFWDRSKNFITV